MYKELLSQEMYDFLKWHVNEIEKEKDVIFKTHYVEETQESIDFEFFFKDYLLYIKNYLSTAKVGIGGNDNCPFVIINSVVDVFDSIDMEDYRYRIVLPYSKQHDATVDCASCISPLGRAFLLKGIGEDVKIEIPTGILQYTIKEITVPYTPIKGKKAI